MTASLTSSVHASIRACIRPFTIFCIPCLPCDPCLTLINAGFFYNYLTRGGRNHPPPRIFDFRTQKLGFKGFTLKYRQILTSRKKIGSIPQKLGPYRSNQNFCQNVENRVLREMQIFKNFDLVHENGSNSVFFGPIHLISFASGH